MLNSDRKIKILILLLLYGVISKNISLLRQAFSELGTETQIQNAIKTLKEKGYIEMVRVKNYEHTANNEKDGYKLTHKGIKEIEMLNKKNNTSFEMSEKVKKRLKNKQYDLLIRLSEVDFLFHDSNDVISRDDIYNQYPAPITHENESLRFHAGFKAYEEIIPIYHIKQSVREVKVVAERKFFDILNGVTGITTSAYNKILVADDERIIDKLIKNMNKDTVPNFINSKEKTYVFYPHRPHEKTYLLTLKENPNDAFLFLRFAKSYRKEFEQGVFEKYPNAKAFERSTFSISRASDKITKYLNPVLFFEVEDMFNWYSFFLRHNREFQETKTMIVFFTLNCNQFLLEYLFKDFPFIVVKSCLASDVIAFCKMARQQNDSAA